MSVCSHYPPLLIKRVFNWVDCSRVRPAPKPLNPCPLIITVPELNVPAVMVVTVAFPRLIEVKLGLCPAAKVAVEVTTPLERMIDPEDCWAAGPPAVPREALPRRFVLLVVVTKAVVDTLLITPALVPTEPEPEASIGPPASPGAGTP